MVNHARQPSIEEEQQINLRQEVIAILYKKFGNRDDIYECADEWGGTISLPPPNAAQRRYSRPLITPASYAASCTHT